MIMLMAFFAALYVWTHYQYAFALLLWHLSPAEHANELYKDSQLIFAGRHRRGRSPFCCHFPHGLCDRHFPAPRFSADDCDPASCRLRDNAAHGQRARCGGSLAAAMSVSAAPPAFPA
jgi:hypothetical protein